MKKKIFLTLLASFVLCFMLVVIASAKTAEVSDRDGLVSAMNDNDVDTIILQNDITGVGQFNVSRTADLYVDFNNFEIQAGGTFMNVSGTNEDTTITFANGMLKTGHDAITINSSVKIIFNEMTFNPGYDGIYLGASNSNLYVEFNDSKLISSSNNNQATSFVNNNGGISGSTTELRAQNCEFTFNTTTINAAIFKVQGSTVGTLYLKDCFDNSETHSIINAGKSAAHVEIEGGVYYGEYDTAATVNGSSATLNNVLLVSENALGKEFNNDNIVKGTFCVIYEGKHIIVRTPENGYAFTKGTKYVIDDEIFFLAEYEVVGIFHDNGFDEAGCKKSVCPVCGDEREEETPAIFTSNGYSVAEDGTGIISGYKINFDALNNYESANSTTLKFGAIFVNVTELNDELTFDGNGSVNLEKKAVQAELKKEALSEFKQFNFKVSGFDPEAENYKTVSALKLVIAMYIYDDGDMYFVQGKNAYDDKTVTASGSTLKVVTLEALLEKAIENN